MRSCGLWRNTQLFRLLCGKHMFIAPTFHQCKVISPWISIKCPKRKYHSLNHLPPHQIEAFLPRVVSMHQYNIDENVTKNDEISTLIQRLELHINRLERVKLTDIEQLLRFMKSGKHVEYSHPGLLLLRCCSSFTSTMSPKLRLALAQSIWDDLKTIGTEFDVDYYNALLACYSKSLHKVRVSDFLNSMGTIQPNEKTYHLLLECASVVGDVEQATYIIHVMKEKGLPANEETFSTLLLGYARAGDMKSALTVMDTAQTTAQIIPSARTYTALLKSYAEIGDFENVAKTYQVMNSQKIILSDQQIMEVCRSFATAPDLITKFLPLLKEKIILTPTVHNTVLELVHLHCETAAYILLNSVSHNPDSIQGENVFALFVSEMSNAASEPRTVIRICNLLMENEAYPQALYKALESALRLSRTNLALTLLIEFKSKGIDLKAHYFWPIIIQKRLLEGEKGALAILRDMQTLGVTVDYETLADYVLPVASLANPELLVQKLKDLGLKLRHVVLPVAVILLQARQIKATLDLCKRYEMRLDIQKLLKPLAVAFSFTKDVSPTLDLLNLISEGKSDMPGEFLLEVLAVRRSPLKTEDILTLLKVFKDKGMKISSVAADGMMKYLESRSMEKNIYSKGLRIVSSIVDTHHDSVGMSDLITHPRNMNGEELEAHLIELKAKNMNTRGVLRHLFNYCYRTGNTKRALEVMEEFKQNGFELSPGMQASLFDLYVSSKDLKAAKSCLADLSHKAPGFVVDSFKIIDYATLLVSQNQYKAAVTALERHAGAGKVIGGPSLLSNCHRLVLEVSTQMDPEHTKHMLHTLVTHGYCTVSNILLGPLIRSYFHNEDWAGAVQEYKRCANEYRKTPLKLELLQHLIVLESQQQLVEDVIAATAAVHGKINASVAYAGALAENGKEKQLQQYFIENPGIIQSSDFVSHCQRLADEGKMETLTILMKVCENSKYKDPLLFYTLMLQIHSKRGDCDEALELWTRMQEKDIQPSSKFLADLASLLKSHNRSIPFVVPVK